MNLTPIGRFSGDLRLAPGQPTKIRYGQTLSLFASDLSHDTSEYKLRLYHPFAPEDADCDTHFQNVTGYLDLFYNDVDLPGENITVAAGPLPRYVVNTSSGSTTDFVIPAKTQGIQNATGYLEPLLQRRGPPRTEGITASEAADNGNNHLRTGN